MITDTLEDETPAEEVRASRPPKDKHMCTWPDCGKTYGKMAKLLEHMRSHTNERPFVCTICPKRFLRKSHLARHLQSSHSYSEESKRPFTCDLCDKSFALKHHLTRHAKLHANPVPYSCPKSGCSESFAKKKQLKQHLILFHNIPLDPSDSPFLSKKTKTYICGECSQVFHKWSVLVAHRKDAHTSNSHACELCSASFGKSRNLAAHVKRVHAGIASNSKTSHICSQCDGKLFSSRSALRVHMATVHENKRPYECLECGKSFGHKHLLARHTRTHSNKDPEDSPIVETPEVPKSLEKTGLAERIAGDMNDGRSFECTECRKRYFRLYDLRRHRQSAHSASETER